MARLPTWLQYLQTKFDHIQGELTILEALGASGQPFRWPGFGYPRRSPEGSEPGFRNERCLLVLQLFFRCAQLFVLPTKGKTSSKT